MTPIPYILPVHMMIIHLATNNYMGLYEIQIFLWWLDLQCTTVPL